MHSPAPFSFPHQMLVFPLTFHVPSPNCLSHAEVDGTNKYLIATTKRLRALRKKISQAKEKNTEKDAGACL